MSIKKYQSILENIEDGYFEADLAGNLISFNDSMCRILGYPKDKLIGMNNRVYLAQDKDNAKRTYQTFNEVYTTGKPEKGVVWEIIRRDGGRRPVETSLTLIKDETGNPLGFRGIMKGFNDRKDSMTQPVQYQASSRTET